MHAPDCPAGVAEFREALRRVVPHGNLVDLVALLGGAADGRVRVFDDEGRFLSADRIHLTSAGARFLGRRMLEGPLAGLPGGRP